MSRFLSKKINGKYDIIKGKETLKKPAAEKKMGKTTTAILFLKPAAHGHNPNALSTAKV